MIFYDERDVSIINERIERNEFQFYNETDGLTQRMQIYSARNYKIMIRNGMQQNKINRMYRIKEKKNP